MSTVEGFHCIQDTSPGPQGVHSRGVPLYTGHISLGPQLQGVHSRGVPLYCLVPGCTPSLVIHSWPWLLTFCCDLLRSLHFYSLNVSHVAKHRHGSLNRDRALSSLGYQHPYTQLPAQMLFSGRLPLGTQVKETASSIRKSHAYIHTKDTGMDPVV